MHANQLNAGMKMRKTVVIYRVNAINARRFVAVLFIQAAIGVDVRQGCTSLLCDISRYFNIFSRL